MNSKPTLLLYGGAFDPPHRGHQNCLELAMQKFSAAKVLVIPDCQPAGAANEHKKPRAAFAHRIAMCVLAFGDLPGAERIHVTSLSSDLPTPNYTLATLSAVASAYPEDRIGLLVGQDQLESFHRWKNPEEILKKALLVVAPRPDFATGISTDLKAAIAALAASLDQDLIWNSEIARLEPMGREIIVLTGPSERAASRIIRADLASTDGESKGWLPANVETYISKNHLYENVETIQ